jgi:uracil-DNA glycosylase
MMVRPAAELVPPAASLPVVREAAKHCTACDLFARGTQTVFGEGPTPAEMMFVGEQPGDVEDRTGHPFVGPAGRLLDEAFARVGIDRRQVYVTNVVKHFKWEPRGKRRIHSKPNMQEIRACRPWLDAELELCRPSLVVCLGATAAQAILGRAFRVQRDRGKLIPTDLGFLALATLHPSAILRAPDPETRHVETERFVDDLRAAVTASPPAPDGLPSAPDDG